MEKIVENKVDSNLEDTPNEINNSDINQEIDFSEINGIKTYTTITPKMKEEPGVIYVK
jgi:hypothetical protein